MEGEGSTTFSVQEGGSFGEAIGVGGSFHAGVGGSGNVSWDPRNNELTVSGAVGLGGGTEINSIGANANALIGLSATGHPIAVGQQLGQLGIGMALGPIGQVTAQS